MLHESTRLALAIALAIALALCPAAALAADDPAEGDQGASSASYAAAQAEAEAEAQADTAGAPAAELYERSLPIPPDALGAGYDGPLSPSSILKGWGEYLYYLRETPISTGSSDFAFSTFERYGVQTGEWETLASLPVPLAYATGCVWEGNFLVCGAVYDTAAGAATTDERIYLYNFERADWVQLDSDGVPLGAGIVNLDGFLRIVGGANGSWSFLDGVYSYDTGSGIGSRVATLEIPAFCPQLAVHQGQIFVYSYGDTIGQFNGSGAARHLQVVLDGDSGSIDSALPATRPASVPAGMPERSEAFGSIAAAIEGLMLVGPQAADGSTDTFILDWDWEGSSMLPYYRTASNARLLGAAACIHDDLLYAAAASAAEPGNATFRATEMLAPSVKNGNDAVWRKGSEKPLVITFTPDYSRYYDDVAVDGVELYGGSDYTAYAGSTAIALAPDYLQTLDVGEHDMAVVFDGYEDGPGAEVEARFFIEAPSSPSPKPQPAPAQPLLPAGGQSGYSHPAGLAMTGDLLLVVPFATIGIGAVAIGIYLIRRKMRSR